jgi:hypothetical protein
MRALILLTVLGMTLGLSGCGGTGGNDTALTPRPARPDKTNNASTPQSGAQPKDQDSSPKPPPVKSGSS